MDDEEKPPAYDVVLLHSATEDGKGLRVLRARDGNVEGGELRPLRDGVPLVRGEIVRLKPREAFPLLCDVEVACEVGQKAGKEAPPRVTHGGPSQVATRGYRANWDAIFGRTNDDAESDGVPAKVHRDRAN